MMILDSLLSVFLVIVAGWLLKRHLVPHQEHWQGLEKLTYFVLVPALILKTLASTALNAVPFVTIGGTLLAANLVGCAILLALRPILATRFGMDGPALLREARPWLTKTRVMFISGYAERDLAKTLEDDRAISFLPKPFTLKQLAERVKAELQAAA